MNIETEEGTETDEDVGREGGDELNNFIGDSCARCDTDMIQEIISFPEDYQFTKLRDRKREKYFCC